MRLGCFVYLNTGLNAVITLEYSLSKFFSFNDLSLRTIRDRRANTWRNHKKRNNALEYKRLKIVNLKNRRSWGFLFARSLHVPILISLDNYPCTPLFRLPFLYCGFIRIYVTSNKFSTCIPHLNVRVGSVIFEKEYFFMKKHFLRGDLSIKRKERLKLIVYTSYYWQCMHVNYICVCELRRVCLRSKFCFHFALST